MAGESARRLTLLPGRNARWSTRSTNRKSVIAEWRRAVESMGAALSCRRDGYHADSISRAYYAIMHAARSSLQLYDVTAESHAGVRRMFGQHLVRPGLVEPEWGVAIGDSADERIVSDYDVATTFDEADALIPHFPYQPCRACRNQQQNYLNRSTGRALGRSDGTRDEGSVARNGLGAGCVAGKSPLSNSPPLRGRGQVRV